MAIVFRFDSISVMPDGSIAVGYTFGPAPLPVEPSGLGTSFRSRLDAVAMKNRFVNGIDPEFMLQLCIAVYSIAASDPNLTGAAALVGKTLTVDPTLPNSVMRYS